MNEPTLRRFLCAALAGAVLFGAAPSFADPLTITTGAMLPDATEKVAYETRLEATNAIGTVRWFCNTSRFSVLREPNSFTETGSAVLGKDSIDDDFDDFWQGYCGEAEDSLGISLPFPFPYVVGPCVTGETYSVTATLDGTIRFFAWAFGTQVHYASYGVIRFNPHSGTIIYQEGSSMASTEEYWSDVTLSPCPFQGDPERTTLFVDQSVPGAVTFRWSGTGLREWDDPDSDPEWTPFDCSATLYEDGTIRYAYGAGNYDASNVVESSFAYPNCFADTGMSFADDIVLKPVSCSFPPGLSLAPDGVVSGTPIQPGLYSFDVIAEDSCQRTNRTFSLVVSKHPDLPPVVSSYAPSGGIVCDPSDGAFPGNSFEFTPTSMPFAASFVGGAMHSIGEPWTFAVDAYDPEGDPLSYTWSVDKDPVAGATNSTFVYTLTDADVPRPPAGSPCASASRDVSCSVTDGIWTSDVRWRVTIINVPGLDGAETNETERTTWYVDASATGNVSDGTSWETAFTNLAAAAEAAGSGDLVLVAPGVYSSLAGFSVVTSWSYSTDGTNVCTATTNCVPISFPGVELRSTEGADVTVIDGGGIMPCLRNVGKMVGFTLRNGKDEKQWEWSDENQWEWNGAASVSDSSFERCIVSNCVSAEILFAESSFDRCLFVDNRSGSGSGWFPECGFPPPALLYRCELENCIVVANIAEQGAILLQCNLYHCTVAENRMSSDDAPALDTSCNAFNSIVWNNFGPDGVIRNYEIYPGRLENGEIVVPALFPRFENCCLNGFHEQKDDLVFGNPRLAGAADGDVRLREGSSCLDAGSTNWWCAETDYAGNPRVQGVAPDIGAREGVSATGHTVNVRVRGHGSVFPKTALVDEGGSAMFTAVVGERPFLGFYDESGGLVSSSPRWTAENVREDRNLVAAFGMTLYVDATNGSDENDGCSWASPKKSIQAAVDSAFDGETVLVAAGVYGPFRTDAKGLRIEGVDGAAATIVDGGGTNRCATLVDTTLVGLTFQNGFADCGGGVNGGKLFDCVIRGNKAGAYGGGLCWSTAVRCRILGNIVRPDDTESGGGESVWIKGGGAESCTLLNCLVLDNGIITTNADDRAIGGGTAGGHVFNSTIVDNWVEGPGRWRGSGVGNSVLHGCILSGNDADGISKDRWTGEIVDFLEVHSTYVGDDPGFVDAANGDYRLREDSGCVDAGDLGGYYWDENELVWDDLDLDGNPRVRGAAVDQGCYESSYEKTQTSMTPVPVPFAWLDSHYADLAIRGGYEERANSTASNGVDEIWKCFVAGVVPTDEDDRFLATIEMVDGTPNVRWTPDLNEGGTKNERVYTVEGKTNLVDRSWGPTNEATRFYRVKVSLPE